MLVAHHLASGVLPEYTCKYSRHDFTLPQLFACLVVKEHQKRSYRGAEALLCDSQHWCRAIGMSKAPDHNTMCRAASVLLKKFNVERLLDAVARWAALMRALGLSIKPPATARCLSVITSADTSPSGDGGKAATPAAEWPENHVVPARRSNDCPSSP